MRARVFCVVLSFWSVCALGVSAGKIRHKAEEKSSLEARVWQLEEELRQLKQVIQELREHVSSSSAEKSRETVEAESTVTHEPLAAGAGARGAEASQVASSVTDPDTMRLYWSNGIRMESRDRRVKLSVGGRIQNDWNFHYQDPNTPGLASDGAEFRRSRLYFSGEIGRVDFKAEYDFAGIPDGGFTDVYVGIHDIPALGSLQIGHFKEPFGLEQLTSSRFLTFLERSLGSSAFAPGRNTGFMFSNTALDDRLHWAAGFFKDAIGTGLAVGDGSYSFTGRLAGTPWRESATRILHLGAAYSHRDAVLELSRFATRPEAHLASPLVNTGIFAADSNDRLGLEAALVYDRFSFQTEFMNTSVDSPQNGDPRFSSFYAEGSLFLTRDSRHYWSGSAAFDRVRPARPLLNGEGGAGAWELAVRYSQIDLDDGFVLGGKEKNFTLGLNWYLNSNSRMMFNFIHADPERFGSLKVLQARFQVDF